MKTSRKKSRVGERAHSKCVCQVMTKKEAADRIQKGLRHLHSTELKSRDPLVKITETSLKEDLVAQYPWESGNRQTFDVTQSIDRSKLIQKVIDDLDLVERRHLRERLATILEELLTNAIYHAYHSAGHEKYQRSKPVQLTHSEVLRVEYFRRAEGIFLSVEDFGGTLDVDRVAKSIARCYEKQNDQIEEKEGGAGLGMYLVFELATHLKIVVDKANHTKISCWIADKNQFDVNKFSFNYFAQSPVKKRGGDQ